MFGCIHEIHMSSKLSYGKEDDDTYSSRLLPGIAPSNNGHRPGSRCILAQVSSLNNNAGLGKALVTAFCNNVNSSPSLIPFPSPLLLNIEKKEKEII